MRRRPEFIFIPTRACDTCGDAVEVVVAPLIQRQHKKPTYVPACDDCGAPEGLVSAEVNLPDGMGKGWIYLCAECIARYDEGEATWAR